MRESVKITNTKIISFNFCYFELEERIHGLLFGLASGDKNGGPFRMAVRLCESLNENGAEYTKSGSWEKYHNYLLIFF